MFAEQKAGDKIVLKAVRKLKNLPLNDYQLLFIISKHSFIRFMLKENNKCKKLKVYVNLIPYFDGTKKDCKC